MYVDRRLAGIQAVQTLSRLNRAHPGKDTTYILDFVNSSEEVLTAFKMYFETAELEAATDPDLIFSLRAKLDSAGHYDDFEVERVVRVELDPKASQGQLISALEPVADRVLKAFNGAKQALTTALATGNDQAAADARDHMSALDLFKGDMAAYLRLYSFLSQIIDYGNTDVEKRAIFYRRLLPLLEFGREREGVDLTGIKLTHHTLKNEGKRDLVYGVGETPKLPGVSEVGSGGIHEKEKALLDEIIARVNDLFGADTTDGDQLVYVNQVLKGKLLESEELAQQAANNTKAQFASSPTLGKELLDAIMDALVAHNSLSKQALESAKIQEGLKDALLGPGQLYEALRALGGQLPPSGE
jgi:type I restriction enzyme R subunit